MTFDEQAIAGVFMIEPQSAGDERGLFARTYCRSEFAAQGIEFEVAQASVSFNTRRGTLRGMHLQVPPHEEAKLVRCIAGSIYDVVLDLRLDSPTQLRWIAVELAAARRNALYVPPGLAHGFVTLEDACEVEYLISTAYEPAAAAGLRWDDRGLGIEWPFEPVVISERDSSFPDVDVELVRQQGTAAVG